MRQLLMLAAVAGLAVARPDLYREKEDFQFSRSSTDEGTKSGFYDSQRGNMGGNYERAHNMDHLAQNQMSGLVRTAEGELGSGAKQQTGSVYTSANSRGVYGSGNYDLSNLEGRNFQEGTSYGAIGGLRSQSSSTSNRGSAAYRGQHLASTNAEGYGSSQSYNGGYGHSQSHDSRYGGYNTAGKLDQVVYSNNQQRSDNLQAASQYDRNTAQNTGYTALDSAYYSQAAGYQKGQVYDQSSSPAQTSNAYGSNIHSRLVSGTPVRIVIRPGTKVVVPVASQTYDATQSASFDQNAYNRKSEVLNGNDQQMVLQPKPKHYESSYSYRKEWERQGTKPLSGAVPLAIPTVNPYPVNSELYEDAQAQTLDQQQQSASGMDSQSHHSSHSGYNVKSAISSQSRQAEYDTRHLSSGTNTGSSAYHGAYNGGLTGVYNGDATGAYNGASNLNQAEDSNAKPKGYQSSYSYHKSWERQGDPYVIKPSTNGLYDGQVSSRLTDRSLHQGAYGNSNQYGSHRHHQSHQSYSSNSDVDCDCDENGHIRVARSYNTHQNPQRTRGDIIGQEDLGLDQQTQQQWNNLEDFGQQTQTLWGQQETENRGDNLKDLGQQIQDQSDVGQQTQNTWELQNQTDLGQQTQDGWILDSGLNGNDGRPTEQKPDTSRLENHGMNIDHQSDQDTFKIVQSPNYQTHNTESQTLEGGIHHHTHTIWDEIKKEEIGQENEDSVESDLAQTGDLDQQVHNIFSSSINTNENSYKPRHQESVDRVQIDLTNSEPNQQNIFAAPNPHPWMYNQVHHNTVNSNQYFAHSWQDHSTSMNSNSFNRQSHSSGSTSGSSIMGLWDKLDNIEKETILSHDEEDEISDVRPKNIDTIFGTHGQHSIFDSSNNDKQRFEGAAHAVDSHVQRDVFDSHTFIKPLQPNTVLLVSTTANPSTTTETINKVNKIRPLDIGRGDIEPEDITNEQIESQPDSKPYKTQEQIETLSLTKEIGKSEKPDVIEDERDFSVMSLDQQSYLEHQDKDDVSKHDSSVTVPTSTTQRIHYHYMHSNEEKETLNTEQQFEDQGQDNLDQQTLVHQFEDGQVNKHHNTDQLMEFAQHSENIGAEQAEQQFETQNIGQSESFHQGNKKHDSQDFGQQSEQFDQVSLSGWNPDDNFNQQEHKLTNWGQENENLEQQSQSGWTENMNNQQVQTVWEPTEDLQQQSQLTETFGQPIEDLSQQTQPAWKPTEDLQQQSQLTETFGQPIEDLSQQIQPAWRPTEDLQQQSQLTETLGQAIKDLSQQSQPAQKPTEDLQQHSQLTEEFTPPMDNLNQQVQTAWVPEDLQQQSQLTETFSEPIDQNKEETSGHKHDEVVEEFIVPKKVAAVDSPPVVDVVTEKPGFWKSVGSKFTNAKDKVSSWFSRS